MPETTDIFEVMSTMRAMRRLKPDPVPDELIRKVLLAGQAAASGGNTQRWRFLVLKDPEINAAAIFALPLKPRSTGCGGGSSVESNACFHAAANDGFVCRSL